MDSRQRFEAEVIARMKESGLLEVEIRTECLSRHGDEYHDGSIDAYWHYWQKAEAGNAEAAVSGDDKQAFRTAFEADCKKMAVKHYGYREGEALLESVCERNKSGKYSVEWVRGAWTYATRNDEGGDA